MSFKAKDLSYDNSQPAFLRRLRGELAGDGSGRHEQPTPRNKRLKKDDEEEDAPTYVLEDTNQSLTKAEYDAMVAGKDTEKDDEAVEAVEDANVTQKATAQHSKDNIAEVGKATKKRKVAKIIGEEKEDEPKESKATESKVIKKAKKKAKPVKLSFGDEEAG
ncbi:hypothetical protein N0V90_001149 [Kalmusia sp. IMI 367209]|nr:hypothetical protein N0V90_001149 [Kalmusia sp. IMI 367209]